uniref:Uncharacterized protein n=1 Tax=Globisporangium ultimum (strain ATCC 200006 / CBS 805.95 / DAOM BR144) TaxID=431595 RepID=K3X345_GLOUD
MLQLPSVRYRSVGFEITTLIQGRPCRQRAGSSPGSRSENLEEFLECETRIVDDYRYEATTLETDTGD